MTERPPGTLTVVVALAAAIAVMLLSVWLLITFGAERADAAAPLIANPARLGLVEDTASPTPAPRPTVASRSQARKPVPAASPSRTSAPKPPRTAAATPTALPRTTGLPADRLWAQGAWQRFSAWVQHSAYCIARHESWNEHKGRRLWTALNIWGGSSASGFAQWLDGTWRVQARRAGVGTQYARAYLAPPQDQAAVFAFQATHHGLYPWHGTGCPGT